MGSSSPSIGLRAILDMSDMDSNSKRYLSSLNLMNTSTAKFVSAQAKGLTQASSSMGGFASNLQRVSSIVAGIVVADVFRGVARAAGDMATEAFKAVSVFQSLKIQLDTIAARNYSQEFGIPVADAFKETAGASKDLLYWIRQIAVTTPFSAESLGQTFALAQAYGFTTEEAKKLITTAGDFTSSMGLTDEVLKRIIYNFGQMIAQGKPTGRELRDLSNSFVPIGTLAERFAKNLGKSKSEIMDMFSSGAISAKEFIGEFEKMVDETVPGSMERMSRTFEGVKNNIGDLIQSMMGFEVLGPIADKVSSDLQDALSGVLNPQNYAIAGAVGESLSYSYTMLATTISGPVMRAVNSFFNLMGFAAPTTESFARAVLSVAANLVIMGEGFSRGLNWVTSGIESILNFFGTSFTQLSSNMYSWGQNIILQFAKGIVNAIVFVIQAITSVAQVITRLLQAHSPPLILPDLDKWGANAMTSYMNGWLQGDFSAFESIGSLLQSAIMSWSGAVDEVTLSERVIGSTVALSKAVDDVSKFGSVTSSALNKVAASAGFAFQDFEKFIRLSFSLQKVQSIAEAVKNALDFSGTGTIDIFGNSVSTFDQLGSLADQFGSGLSDSIRSYVSDASNLVRINSLLTASQQQLNDVTSHYDAILSSLNDQLTKVKDQQEDITRVAAIDKTLKSKILTAAERQRLELEKQQLLLERQIRDTEAQKKSSEEAIKTKISGLEDEKKIAEDKTAAERKSIQDISNAQVDSAKKELDNIKSLIDAQIKMNELLAKNAAAKLAAKKAKAGSGVGGGLDTSVLDDLLKGSTGSLGKATDQIKLAFDELWAQVLAEADYQWLQFAKIFEPITIPWNTMISNIKDMFEDGEMLSRIEAFKARLGGIFDPIKEFANGPEASKIADSLGKMMGTIGANLFLDTKDTGKSVLTILLDGLGNLSQNLSEKGPAITDLIDKITAFINDSAFPKFKDALSFVINTAIPILAEFALVAAPVLLGFLKYFVDNSDVIIRTLLEFKALQVLSGIGTTILAIQKVAAAGGLLSALGVSGTAIVAAGPLVALAGAIALLGYVLSRYGPEVWKNLTDINAQMLIIEGKALEIVFEPAIKNSKPIAAWTEQANTDITAWITQANKDIKSWTDQAEKNVTTWTTKAGKDVTSWSSQAILDIQAWSAQAIVDSGSWMAKATTDADNWIGQAETDIASWATKASTSVSTWVDESTTKGHEFTEGFVQSWTDTLQKASDSLVTWAAQTAEDFGTWVSNLGVLINTKYTEIFGEGGIIDLILKAFAAWILLRFLEWFGESGTIMTQLGLFGTYVSDKWTEIFGEGGTVDLILQLATVWLTAKFTELFGPEGIIITKFTEFKTFVETKFTEIFGSEGVIATKFGEFKTSVSTLWEGIFGPEGAIASKINGFFSKGGIADSVISNFETFGKNMMEGIIKGIGSAAVDVANAVKKVIDNAHHFGEKVDEQKSPSKRWARFGENQGKGMALGLDQSTTQVLKSVGGLLGKVEQRRDVLYGRSSTGSVSNQYVTNSKNVTVQLNASYANSQSQASIRSDLSAMLAATRM